MTPNLTVTSTSPSRIHALLRISAACVLVLGLFAGNSCSNDEPQEKPAGPSTGGDTPSVDAPSQRSTMGKLIGLVRNLEGMPVSGATVRVRRDHESLATPDFWRMMPIEMPVLAEVVTDRAGRFEISVPDGPQYAVVASFKGTDSNRVGVYVNRPFGLTIGAKDARPPQDDGRDGKGSVSGRVLAKDTGKPIAAAKFRRIWKDKVLTTSDASGAFRIGWFSKSASEPVIVIAPGFAIGLVPSASFREGKNTTVSVSLERGIGVRGRIVDADGKPVEGIDLLCEDDILTEDTQYGSVAWRTKTDENGRWAFEQMKPGSRYWARGITDDGVTIELAEGRFPADATESIEVGDVAIGPTSSVHGRVTRKDGKSIEQAPKAGQVVEDPKVHYLRLWDKRPTGYLVMRNTPWVPLNPNGDYRIPKLAPGKYELAFWISNDLETEVRTVTIGREPKAHRIDVEIGPGRSFEGYVFDENDKPIDAVLLRAIPDWENDYFPLVPPGELDHLGRFLQGNVRVITKPNGHYLLTRIRSNVPIQLRVAKEGYVSQKIKVPADAPPPDKIVLQKR